MRAFRGLAVVVLLLSLSGCIYADVKTPLAYRSPTPGDVQGGLGEEVSGEACNQVILGLVAWGDGGYQAAVENARTKVQARMIADVRADYHLYNVLWVYQEACTRVTGRAVK